jgi:site-specific DNA-cytosine methylase
MGYNVLSLCDGISGGYTALKRANKPINKYYASEIDKHAIKISQATYPDIIQLGDMKNWRNWIIDWSNIDLLFAGFPCQAWSVAGKQKGDNDPRGELVHVVIEIWEHIKKHNPDVKVLFENVKMKKEFKDYIDNLFGIKGVLLNSALVSAQNRERYYWCSWAFPQPEDRGIMLKDVVHENVDLNKPMSENWCEWWKKNAEFQLSKKYSSLSPEKAITINL